MVLETALVCVCVCVRVCGFVACETSPQQVSAEEGSLEAETWRKKAITVVEHFVLFVEAVLCGPLLMSTSKLVNNESEKKVTWGLCVCVCVCVRLLGGDVWWGQSPRRVLTFSLIGPQAEDGVTAPLYIDLATNTYSVFSLAKPGSCFICFHVYYVQLYFFF